MSVKKVTATINGQEHILTYNESTGKYETTINAPAKSSYPLSGHYYPVKVTAEDDAGNKTEKDATDAQLGKSLQLKVVEKVAPTIAVTAPTEDALLGNGKPTFTWTVTDDDSGVAKATIKLTVDGTPVTEAGGIEISDAEKGFTCTYTPSEALDDGDHVVLFDAADNDGNAAKQVTVNFKVDTTPPVLSVDSPADNLVTNQGTLEVTGTTSDATSNPVTVTVQVGSGAKNPATVQPGGAFTCEVELSEGSNVITVTATDSAGKTTTVTRTVVLDTTAPVIVSVTATPNPVDAGKTCLIAVEVTD